MDKYSITSLIFEYIQQNPKTFLIYCSLILALPITDVILPHYYGKIIANLKTRKNISKYIYIVIFFIIIVQILNTGNEFLEIYLYPRMIGFIRNYYLNSLFENNSTHLREIEIGRVLSQIVRFPATVYNYIDDIKNIIVPCNVIYIFEIIYLCFTDYILAIIVGLIMISVNLGCYYSLNNCVALSEERDHIYNNINEGVDDLLRNMVSVLNNDKYDYELDLLNKEQDKFIECSIKGTKCVMHKKGIFYMVFICLMVLFIWRSYYIYNKKLVSIEKFISIFIITLYLFSTVIKHTAVFKNLTVRFGTIYESFSILKSYEFMINKKVYDPINTNTCISIRNISFGYPGKSYILENINLDIMYGDNIVIVGDIGTGKSSFIKLLMRYYIAQEGEIYLHGKPYSHMSEIEIRKQIGYISQMPILFNRTILENIKYSKENCEDSEVYELIKYLDLEEHFKRYPNGLLTNVGKHGSNLSGGEKQVVWVLRVLLQNPDILILDEPTSAMDSNTRDTLIKILIKIAKNKTIIAITHDKALLKHFNKVLIVRDKKLINAS